MDSKKNEFRVGLAVFISLIILVGGIMWGKGFSLRSQRYKIEVVFDNIGGLEAGSNVLVNGVAQGRVRDIVLRGGKVYVIAAINKTVVLYSDYRVTIESPTVMGGKVLSIDPGEAPPVADVTHTLQGETPLGIGEAVAIFQNISADVQTTVRNLDTLIVSLKLMTVDTANRTNFAGILANTNSLTAASNRWIRENGDDMSSAVKQMDATLGTAQTAMQNLEMRLSNTMISLDSAAAQVTSLSLSLRELSEQIKSGEGTVGKLFYDEAFYNRIMSTMREVDSLASSIRTRGVSMRHKIVLF